MRPLCLLIFAFQFVWLNVVVPAHVRGAVTYAAPESITPAHGCDAADPLVSKAKRPTPDDAARCVICHVASLHALPPTFTFDLRPGKLLCVMPERPLRSVRVLHQALPYFPNGPPARLV